MQFRRLSCQLWNPGDKWLPSQQAVRKEGIHKAHTFHIVLASHPPDLQGGISIGLNSKAQASTCGWSISGSPRAASLGFLPLPDSPTAPPSRLFQLQEPWQETTPNGKEFRRPEMAGVRPYLRAKGCDVTRLPAGQMTITLNLWAWPASQRLPPPQRNCTPGGCNNATNAA